MHSARNNLIRRALVGAAVLALLALPAAAQGVAPAAAEPEAPRARAFAAFSGSAQQLRDSIVAMARAQVGLPYNRGGHSPDDGFDCSGLVHYVLTAFDAGVPRTAAMQSRVGRAIEPDTSRLRPGDLLTFGKGRNASHIGIYVGGGRFVHASSVAGRVVESPVHRHAARVKPLRGARRVLTVTDEDGTAK